MELLWASWIGRIRYARAYDLQRAIAARRAAGAMPDTLLLLEHDPVYTLGRRATDDDVIASSALLSSRGIEVVRTDRGGLATYHGPGQLVGYPILDLGVAADVPGYVHTLEEALIATAADFGVRASRVEGSRGIWVGDDKLAAIGVHVSRGVTTHGFAMNVSTDLTAFGGIIPCGITDKGVTSLDALTGRTLPLAVVAKRAAHHLARALDRSLFWRHPAALEEVAASA